MLFARPAADASPEVDRALGGAGGRAALSLVLDRAGLADGPHAALVSAGTRLRPAVRFAALHPDPAVRSAAADLLGEADVPDAPALLLPLLEDADPAVRSAAAAGLEARLTGWDRPLSDAEAASLSATVLGRGPVSGAAGRWLVIGSGEPDMALRRTASHPNGRAA